MSFWRSSGGLVNEALIGGDEYAGFNDTATASFDVCWLVMYFGFVGRNQQHQCRTTDTLTDLSIFDLVFTCDSDNHIEPSHPYEVLANEPTCGVDLVDGLHSQELSIRKSGTLIRKVVSLAKDSFSYYKDNTGSFKDSLTDDVQRLLDLYEAAYMRVKGEVVLDDALFFTRTHLENIAKDPLRCDSTTSRHIREALERPIRKRLPRLDALRYIPFYEQQVSHNKSLLKLAKLGLNRLQSLHKKKLSQLSKWWKGFDIPKNLMRDRLVEMYFWTLGVYYEPQYSHSRIFFAKWPRCLKMKESITSYITEAKWREEGYVPTVKELKSVRFMTAGYKTFTTSSSVGMGETVTEEAFKWIETNPPLVKAASAICRLMDDMVGYKEEQQRAQVASAIESYMKQYDVEEEKVHDLLKQEVEDA
ncbi:sesquiterpene synthase TPS1-like [Bidens hawaiensis]|uniref:sesquiterpene synthase TPS1-like n=1 Tax=Bidens hawaiensis TaxID=980011 RepID=UPI00404A388B